MKHLFRSTFESTLASVFLVAGLLVTSGVRAEDAALPGVEQRQRLQDKRIEQGVQSGTLNPAEAERLERGQARIETLEKKAQADGEINRKERRVLKRAQNHESRAIRRLKTNHK